MSGSAELASGSKTSEDQNRGASALLAKITADRSPSLSDPKVSEFFRTQLWAPTAQAPGSFQDNVLDKAVDLVAPSSSAAPPQDDKKTTLHPKPSGVNAVEDPPTPVTPRRSPRLQQPATTPPPAKRNRSSAEDASKDKRQPGAVASPPALSPAKSPSPLPLRPILKKTASNKKATKPSKTIAKSKKDSKALVATSGNDLHPSNWLVLKKLREPSLTKLPVKIFTKLSKSSKAPTRPQRCRVPPLQAWRNERLVYERVAGSMTPSVAAVELDMTPPTDSITPPRMLRLPALQPPLEDLDAVEYVGISTRHLTSKVYALPLAKSTNAPCTVALEGSGIIHVFYGTLRFAQEGGEEQLVCAGSTMLVKGPGMKLVAPAYAATYAAEVGIAGVRFRWVERHNA